MKKAKEITKKIDEITQETVESWSDNSFQEDYPYNLHNILDADTPQKINKASLGRLYQHFQQSEKTSWAIFTSWRNKASKEANIENLKSFKERLRKWGYFRLVGHGQEKDEQGNTVSVEEPSYFIIGIPLEEALKLAEKYGQYGIIYAGPETDGDVCLYQSNGTLEERWKKFHPGKISKFYSIIQGRPFFFESRADGWIEGVSAYHHGVTEVPGVNRSHWIVKNREQSEKI